MCVINGSDKCKELITRRRTTKQRVEESTIDLVITSDDLKKDVQSLVIDVEVTK